MTLTVEELVAQGTLRAEFLYHVGGMPWCVHTSGLDYSDLSNAQKTRMFGLEDYSAGPALLYANNVDAYPYLDKLGKQSIRMVEGKAALSGGAWGVGITHDLGELTNWTHSGGPRSTIQGIEGLSAYATPAHDSSIAYGYLYDDFGKSDTALYVEDDVGDRLHTLITATGNPTVLWVGNECIAASAVANTAAGINITVGERGLLRSKKQGWFMDKLGTRQVVTDVPMGIAGRPCYLWMFAVDEDGDIVDGPIMLRHGKVERPPSYSNGLWQVPCLPWWSWLDYDIEMPEQRGEIDKYTFSKASASQNGPPHLQFAEWNEGGSAWGPTLDVWLCADDSVVRYDTYNAMLDGIITAMEAASAADGTFSWNFTMTEGGPRRAGSATQYIRCRGALPVILGWFSQDRVDGSGAYMLNQLRARSDMKPNPWDTLWWDDAMWISQPASTDDYSTTPGLLWRPEYILQFYNEDDNDIATQTANIDLMTVFPVTPVSGAVRIYLKEDYDVTSFEPNTDIQLGYGGTDITKWIFTPNAMPTLSHTKISGVGSGPPSNNFLTINTTEDYTGSEVLIGDKAEIGPDWYDHHFTHGMYLYYGPGVNMGGDPWRVGYETTHTTDKISNLFKALLGDTSVITLPERIMADHVPDALDEDEWDPTIDWGQVDAMVAGALENVEGVSFGFTFNGKVNLWKELQAALRFVGLTPYFEYDAVDGQYKIRARTVASLSATAAQLAGRHIDQHKTMGKAKINNKFEATYNTIKLKANYSASENNWEVEQTLKAETGFEPTGGKAVVVEVASRFIRLDTEDPQTWTDVLGHFGRILAATSDPQPIISIGATVRDVLAYGAGVETLVSVDDVPFPFDGTLGLSSSAALVTEMSTDLDKMTTSYTMRVAPTTRRGWGPALRITDSSAAGDTVTVKDISDSGKMGCGTALTEGWFDHWFFGAYRYNTNMTAPEATGGGTRKIKLIEYNAKAPTVITGLTAATVSSSNYTVAAAASNFMTITGTAGWVAASFDVAKSWVCVFDDRDTTGLVAEQVPWIYVANSNLELQDSAGAKYNGDAWR